MRRIYTPPTITSKQPPNSTVLQNSSIPLLVNSSSTLRSSLSHKDSLRQYITQQIVIKPIRGRELFIRSIRRITEQIRDKKDPLKNDRQFFLTFEEAISIFNELTFMKCVLLKKKLLD